MHVYHHDDALCTALCMYDYACVVLRPFSRRLPFGADIINQIVPITPDIVFFVPGAYAKQQQQCKPCYDQLAVTLQPCRPIRIVGNMLCCGVCVYTYEVHTVGPHGYVRCTALSMRMSVVFRSASRRLSFCPEM